jgi:predicted nucleotidyltransferase
MSMTYFDQDQLVARLKGINPARILLFGSYAYGTPTPESDIDILILKDTVHSRIRESNEARRALRGLGKSFDMIVASVAEYDYYKTQVNTVFAEASNKGIVLYERK